MRLMLTEKPAGMLSGQAARKDPLWSVMVHNCIQVIARLTTIAGRERLSH